MNDITIKIVLVGETNVGKTSIVNSYIYNNYKKTCDCTIGASFASKKIKIKYCKSLNKIHEDDSYNKSTLSVNIHIWDTAGQEKYKALVPMYHRTADILFYVNDITSNNIKYKLSNDILDKLKDNCLKVIIFNKIDLLNNVQGINDNNDYIYYNVSAMKKININELFISSVLTYLNKNLNYILQNKNDETILLHNKYERGKCCNI